MKNVEGVRRVEARLSQESEHRGLGSDGVDSVAAEGIDPARSVIEISDSDYRSFCWPCHALEEIGGDKADV